MRTNKGTLVTLDTVGSVPNGNEGTYAALLELGGAGMPCAVLDADERRNGKEVAVLCVDGTHDLVDEVVAVAEGLLLGNESRPCGINGELLVLAAAVNGRIVLVDDIFALLAVGLHDEVLHLLDSLVNGDNARDAEECGLENGVGTVAETDFLGNLGGVDVVNGDVVVGEILLHLVGKVGNEFVTVPDGVQQERTALLETTCHIVHVEVSLLVASHEVGCRHEVSGADGFVTETEVRAGEAARLLGVVGEVSLAILVGGLTDNLDRVLVGAYGTVGAEAVELGLEHTLAAHGDFLADGEREERNVILNAEGEVVLGLGKSEVVVNRDDLCGRGVVGAEAVATAYDNEVLVAEFVESVLNVEIEGFAVGAGFLRTVEHADALNRSGKSLLEVLEREGTVEVNGNHADLFTLGSLEVDNLADSLGSRAHADDDVLSVGGSVVREGTVLAARDSGNLIHVVADDVGNGIVVRIGRLAMCKEHVGVLGHTAHLGMLGRKGTLAEFPECLLVDEGLEILLVNHLDLLILVRGTETVEEVEEGNAALEGSQVSYAGKVHHLLYGAFGQHGETGLAACHNVLVVTEDTEGVGSKRTGGNMEDRRNQFARNLVHVGNHQEQTLRSCERSGKSTGLESTVNGTGSAALRLHLLNENGLAKDVLAALGSPFIDVLCHR